MDSDRHIDDAIDLAVREIMRAEPRAGLRGRVLTEIERPSGGLWFRPAFAGAALLAVAAVLIAVLLRPATPTGPESIAVRQDSPAVAPLPTAAPEVKAPSPAERDAKVTPPLPVRQRERDRVLFPPPGMVAAASVPVEADPTPTLESLPESAVGTADAKTPEPPIVVPRIEVTPISVPPIVIPPLPRSH